MFRLFSGMRSRRETWASCLLMLPCVPSTSAPKEVRRPGCLVRNRSTRPAGIDPLLLHYTKSFSGAVALLLSLIGLLLGVAVLGISVVMLSIVILLSVA